MSRIKSFLRKNWINAILVVVALAALVVAVTLLFGPRSAKGEGEVTFIVGEIQKKVEFEKGDNAFELFEDQEEFEFDYSESEFGIFINGINGVFGEDTGEIDEDGYPIWTYWALYVNDEFSMVGISQVELIDGIVIEFRFG